jgi:DNA (cytosine-5)-methyltransferase 1
MASFYNEIEPYAAQWLRNLIKEGLIPDGEVSTTSIVDLRPSDLAGFTQCHFFAGIGGWSLALRLAGWPNDRPIWTGSCPCQPFSVAGKGAGIDDPRHLWPHFHRLIAACRPPVVMGEQVAGAAGYGWLDGVRADLAREGYASRGVDIPACAVDAPHIRQRLYWVATDLGDANMPHGEGSGVSSRVYAQHAHADCGGAHSHMANASHERCQRVGLLRDGGSEVHETSGASEGYMAHADEVGRGRWPRDGDGERDRQAREWDENHGVAARSGEDRLDVADTATTGLQSSCNARELAAGMGSQQPSGDSGGNYMADADYQRRREEGSAEEGSWVSRGSPYTSFWSDHIWLTGADGKSRRAKPGLSLLVDGPSGGVALVRAREDGTKETHTYSRVGALRAFGNAIVAPLAKKVIMALMEVLDGEQSLQEDR